MIIKRNFKNKNNNENKCNNKIKWSKDNKRVILIK